MLIKQGPDQMAMSDPGILTGVLKLDCWHGSSVQIGKQFRSRQQEVKDRPWTPVCMTYHI